ncbi:type II secretion system protein [Hydrogenophaga sp. PAMC20947]|uniref:prepilin-type N-terminal cleavage/methylation domain-containing protein n=1 Tax=Hydrogenophaga sp. PAMC20947 TaxID=2565558 RepID=UPI00109E009E|nr:type II secretion system protein [Hydrogenophaga sp. PAMC20947]QCB45686.1 type II secretion system protein [Hydrogenophaga sp. PAMC20947]
MTQTNHHRVERGFTLIEMVITLALVGLISMFAVPLYEMTATRYKEAELRQALRTIRAGIDAYKSATDTGSLPREAGESGYPPTLKYLIEPQDLVGKAGFSDSIAAQRLVILRQLPRDPFATDPEMTAEETWNTRAYASRPDDPQPGDDVFDVSSRSPRIALDGTPYTSW